MLHVKHVIFETVVSTLQNLFDQTFLRPGYIERMVSLDLGWLALFEAC